MKDPSRTNQKLIDENALLKQRIQELEQSESERKRMKEALRLSEQELNAYFESAGDAIYALEIDTRRILNCNSRACLDLGYSRDELLKLSATDIESSLSSGEVDAIHHDLKPGEVRTVEGMHKRKDGSVFPVEIRFSLLSPTQSGLIIAIARDITERKRTEDETAVLVEIGRLIGSTLDINEVYERFAAQARKLIPFDRIHVNLKSPDGETFTIAYVSGTDIAGRRVGDKVPLAGSITEVLFRTRSSMLLLPVNHEDIVSRFPSASAVTTFHAGMRSIMVVPLISRDQVIGGLHFRAKTLNAYTGQDLRLAERIGEQIAGAIANAQIFNNLSKTERELRESEEKYRILFNNERASIYIFDLETLRFLDANDSSLRLYGYSREEMLGGMRAIDISAEPEKSAGSYKIASESGTIFIPLRWHRKKDGTVFPVEIVGGPYVWKGRRVMFGLIQDISERKQAEEETATLINIERLVGSTLEINEVYDQFATETKKLIPFDNIAINLYNSQDNTMIAAYTSGLDIDGRKQGDPLALDGSLSEAVISNRASRLVQPASTDDIIREFPRLSVIVKAGIRSIICIPLIYRDEVIGVLHFRSKKRNAYTEKDRPLAESIGMQIAGAIANAKLFSELRKTEQSLRNSEKKFRTLVENAAVGITEVEAGTGRFLAVNPMLCKMVGRTEHEMLTTTFMAITHPEDLNLSPSLSKRMYSGEFDHYSIEKRYLRKDGGVIWVNITISRLWKPGEAPGRSITIVHDITERKQLEQALKETLDQLESRVQERTIELEETNIALRVLLRKGDKDQKRLEENLQSNVNQLVTPFLSRLRVSQSNPERLTYLNILETNLSNIVSPFINRLSAAYRNLTPKEIQIAELVKQGKRSKEIAELFGLSVGTVITHRNNIRKKLDLKSKDANLRSHLLSLV